MASLLAGSPQQTARLIQIVSDVETRLIDKFIRAPKTTEKDMLAKVLYCLSNLNTETLCLDIV